MKTYPGRSTFTQFRKTLLSASVHLSEAYLLFPCTLLLCLVEPHFNYCTVVWDGLSRQLSEKLQKLQNHADRVITKSSYDTNSSYLLNFPGWDNLSVRRAKQKANLMFKCVNKFAPVYLYNMFTPKTLSFDLRDASQKLYLPKPRTDYLKRSFSYSGASRWIDLPEELRFTEFLRIFKRGIDK